MGDTKIIDQELKIIELNSQKATAEIRNLLENNDVTVEIGDYYGYIYLGDTRIVNARSDLMEDKIKCSYPVSTMYVDEESDENKLEKYANELELSSKVMRKEFRTKISEILVSYIDKVNSDIKSLQI